MIRILRRLRMFRVMKMGRHVGEANVLLDTLRASGTNILVFVFGVLTLVCVEGTLKYLIEGRSEGSGFASIPMSIYWGFVTAEIGRRMRVEMDTHDRGNCGFLGHDPAADYCKMCGKELE